ncbi:hypothetical protein AB0875_28880 [Micromonospora gifhornensis]|uniref:hypothetical protein n=1 Tax=Micromonospora gifhornensis TaxID=84594 RepID=UPI003453084B
MTAPETPAVDPMPALPKPLLTPGRNAAAYDGPAFDPADVVAKVPPPRPTRNPIEAGDPRDPAAPVAPPAWVTDIPADLAAALGEYAEKRAAWTDAVDAVEDYRDEARTSRIKRDAAIADAGRAVAQGKPRPKIPSATTEADEAVEVAILARAADTRRAEVNAAARKADRVTATYAAQWAAEAIDRFGPALDEATTAVQAAYEAASRAEAVLGQAAFWRSLALITDLKRAGVNVSERQRVRIMSDLLDASKPWQYANAESQHRNPAKLLNDVHVALGTLRTCDPGVIPAADMLYLPGGFEVSRDLWYAIYNGATEEQKRRFRERHTGGRLLRHERER